MFIKAFEATHSQQFIQDTKQISVLPWFKLV